MKMKYIISCCLLLVTIVCQGQNKLFEKYENAKDVKSVYISKTMFDMMMPAIQQGGLKLNSVVGKIESLQMLMTHDRKQAEQMRKDFTQSISKEYEELMRFRQENKRVTFNILKKDENINELIMLTDGDDNYLVIKLSGNFTLQDIQEIAEEAQK